MKASTSCILLESTPSNVADRYVGDAGYSAHTIISTNTPDTIGLAHSRTHREIVRIATDFFSSAAVM